MTTWYAWAQQYLRNYGVIEKSSKGWKRWREINSISGLNFVHFDVVNINKPVGKNSPKKLEFCFSYLS